MMNIKTFTVNPLGVNCYVLSDEETHEAAVIDCGCMTPHEFEQIADYCDEAGLHPTLSLQTHAHFDHVLGADMLHNRYGLQPHCHTMERTIWERNPQLVNNLCGLHIPMPQVEPVYDLTHGLRIPLGSTTIHVLHTPGHTPGGVSFYAEKAGVVFSGDTLFRCGLGRTDMPGGDWEQEVQSVQQVLFTLPGETRVLPGHGTPTDIDFERHNNPYMV
ncbi:MAG: MBL fold metallo-hydrolase [Bacteroidaceae bacterium]|nr:MBL fold metallo-hydrolase [Bacteroidaceae bacterium]